MKLVDPRCSRLVYAATLDADLNALEILANEMEALR